MRSHWSLVLFTLLVQSAIGNVWCIQLALFFNVYQPDALIFKYQAIAAVLLVLPGLAAAMAHLGKAASGIHAVRNIGTSWLSREIAAVNLFAGFLVVIAGFAVFKPGFLNSWIMLGQSSIGCIALFAMIRVYLLRTIPVWNHARTPLDFLGASLVLGAVQLTLCNTALVHHVTIGPEKQQMVHSETIAFVVLSLGFILKILAAGRRSSGRNGAPVPLVLRQPVMQAVGYALWSFSMLPALRPEYHCIVSPVAAALLVAGEIIHRINFYNSYHRVGL